MQSRRDSLVRMPADLTTCMPASAPVPHSDSDNVKQPITARDLWAEAMRIGKGQPRNWRRLQRGYIALVLVAGAAAGHLTHTGGTLVERIKSDPMFLKIALIYVGYEAVMKTVEAAQDDKQEFDAALKWLTLPIRIGIPLAAVGFLIGDNMAGFLDREESLARTGAVIGVCAALLVGGLLRAAYVNLSTRQGAAEPPDSPEPVLASAPTH